MDFIAQKCKLGQALSKALEEIVPDQKVRDSVMSIYKKIFREQMLGIKDQLPKCNVNATCFSDREYPNQEEKQFFECLATRFVVKPQKYNFKQTSEFVKVQAIESQNVERKGRRSSKDSRKIRNHIAGCEKRNKRKKT